ncbi:aliphatic sulfonate ABC transporter substrate-binding protein [Dethiosulfovibrio sp. F2B]|uniref:aliphatic sulfonate ABC transporter substrate-binding protein n=1 Tax=Dethiosulfovibrio faecalis TaxID=2720018 RepID=UPI001F456E8F|nr:aliphatic sulfonate ABC transporter substrate-binding protein [Dethiosulfovibrio faecalis]MCF4152022.1 aliphatic sulfonate ABC transporter substrate-binding protein [Dethiosulfovibrio faecalis]
MAITVVAAVILASTVVQTTAKEKELSVTYVKAPLNVPSILQKELKLIEKAFPDFTVSHPELTAGPKQTAGLASGSVDVANCLGGTSAILAYANGVDLKVIGIFARSPKAFTVLAKDKDIASIADLKGKKIAGPKGTILHQLLVAALKREGLSVNDVQFLGMGLADGVTAMMNGSVDACLAAGPAVLRSTERGARIITTGEGLVDATTVIAVRGELLRDAPDLVRRFMKVDEESVNLLDSDRTRAIEITAEETGLSVDDVKTMLPLYDFDSTIRPSDVEELKRTQDFLFDNGMLPHKVDIEKMIATI